MATDVAPAPSVPFVRPYALWDDDAIRAHSWLAGRPVRLATVAVPVAAAR